MSHKTLLFLFYLTFASVYVYGLLDFLVFCNLFNGPLLESLIKKLHFLTIWNYVSKILNKTNKIINNEI